MTPRKMPMRMCVGCRQMRPKRELIRVVRDKDGAINLDRIGKMPGRGAYICPQAACLERALKTRALDKALDKRLGDDIVARLKEEITHVE